MSPLVQQSVSAGVLAAHMASVVLGTGVVSGVLDSGSWHSLCGSRYWCDSGVLDTGIVFGRIVGVDMETRAGSAVRGGRWAMKKYWFCLWVGLSWDSGYQCHLQYNSGLLSARNVGWDMETKREGCCLGS